MPGMLARYNCLNNGIEKDIVIQRFRDKNLEVEISVEVNGVFHYARNSEALLGKDIVKQNLLKKLGYRVLTVPYFDWAILETQKRRSYLEDLIK